MASTATRTTLQRSLRNYSFRATLVTFVGVLAIAVPTFVVWHGAQNAATDDHATTTSKVETDPRHGVVPVVDYRSTRMYKTCDGTTLTYFTESAAGGGVTAVPNSPECR